MSIPLELTNDRPTCGAYVSGRMFYGFQDRVFYSQVLQQNQYFYLSRCYQQNDPTSETNSDSYPTDGGVIPIDEAKGINSITPFRGGAVVTATNGVWFISGSNGVFTSDDFTVTKLTDDGCVSPKSVVNAFSALMFFGRSGIFITNVNEYGETSVTPISKNVIQSFFDGIDAKVLPYIKGALNSSKKQIEWIIPANDATDRNQCTKGLIYDLNAEAFWVNEYMGGNYILVDLLETKDIEEDGSLLYLTPLHTYLGGVNVQSKLDLQLSKKNGEDFKDCDVDMPQAYLETAPVTLGKFSLSKTTPMVAMHFQRTEKFATAGVYDYPSSCNMYAKWDFNTATNALKKWQNKQQVYRLRDNTQDGEVVAEDVLFYKARVRGRGRGVSLRFEQEANKDFQLLGYSIDFQAKGRM